MGDRNLSRTSYETAKRSMRVSDTHVTKEAEQKVAKTGKLADSVNPAVDPLRRSLMRFEKLPDGRWMVTVGVPIPYEEITDTTGSMGKNVDITMKNLPDTYESIAAMISGCDLQVALGIFGDEEDKFILQRPQFEMEAEKIVKYLVNMVPERDGHDWEEDPQYGLFAAAYLTDAYANRIGLKGYHFCISDAPAHDKFSVKNLERVFGNEVFDYLKENQKLHQNLEIPTEGDIKQLKIEKVVKDLLKISHAFFLQVNSSSREEVNEFWASMYGSERVILIPNTKCAPQVKAAIVGLTEGTLSLSETREWLVEHDIDYDLACDLTDQLSKIPLRAQVILKESLPHPLPKKGDVFQNKTDLWPVDAADEELLTEGKEGMKWDL